MITRQQYLENSGMDNHRKYYAQFVNPEVKFKVLSFIGLDALLKSTDEHLNDIPMKKWDSMSGFVWKVIRGEQIAIQQPRNTNEMLPIDYQLLKETGEGYSNATAVCIYKEAARQIIEKEQK